MSLDEKVSDEKNALSIMDTISDEGAEDAYHPVELEVDLDFFLSKLYPEERFIVERSYGIPIEMNNREIAKAIGCHYSGITGKRRDVMKMLKRLGKALRGSVSEQKQAIEDPQSVMRGDKLLIDPADTIVIFTCIYVGGIFSLVVLMQTAHNNVFRMVNVG